jgi:hypothetical protein
MWDVGSRSKGPGEMERSSPGWLRVSVAGGDLRHWKWTVAAF